MNCRHVVVVLLCAFLLPAFAAERGEGSCDQSANRVKSIVFSKAEGYTEGGETVDFVEACTGERRTIKRCAIAKSEKRELQKACFPKDGSPDYFEVSYRIEFYKQQQK